MTVNHDHISRKGLRLIEYSGLFVITLATLVSAGQEVYAMIQIRQVTLADLLMLFIYLEVIAMVSVYLDSGKLPIRMPIYIAIVALARYLAIGVKDMDTWQLISVSEAIVILACAVLVIRYGHLQLPYGKRNNL